MQPDINLFGLKIYTFGLMLGIAFLSCLALTARRMREKGIKTDYAYEAILAAFIGGIIGARAWYLIANRNSFDEGFWHELISGFGLVFYGGLLGGATLVLLWAHWRGIPTKIMLNIGAPVIPLGNALGRDGCQLSGDGDYGKPSNLPWAMSYPHGTDPTDVKVQPTPIYETVTLGLVAYTIWILRDRFNNPTRVFALYFILGGLERFLVEFARHNERVLWGLTVAQLVSIGLVITGSIWWTLTREGS